MKTIWIFRVLFAATLSAGSFPSPAQSANPSLSVNVPFGFELGPRHFAPGSYSISVSGQGILSLKNGYQAALLLGHWEHAGQSPRSAKIVFNVYGERYFLRQVWPGSDTSYVECPESRAERLARAAEPGSDDHPRIPFQIAVLHRRP